MKKKLPFLLLELLIALTLVSFFALPLIRTPLETLHQETACLIRMQLELESDLVLAEIRTRLYQNTIPWDKLNNGEPYKEESNSTLVELPGVFKQPFKQEILLTAGREKKGVQGELYRLINIIISFTPIESGRGKTTIFEHQLFLEKT